MTESMRLGASSFPPRSRWGRQMSEKRVVPTSARAAKSPKSDSSDEEVNISPTKAPIVVKLPTVMG